MAYQLRFEREAVEELKKIPKEYQKLIKEKLQLLADNPENLKNNIKALKGGDGFFRLRVGNYRVIYKIYNEVIIIYHIRHRKSAYD